METCGACKQEIVAGPITKIVDGILTEDGEFEPQNTETYHASGCIKVDW